MKKLIKKNWAYLTSGVILIVVGLACIPAIIMGYNINPDRIWIYVFEYGIWMGIGGLVIPRLLRKIIG